MTTVSAIVLVYGEEPSLEKCVHALLASRGVTVDVVLVDNGCTDGAVDRLDPTPGLTIVRPGANLGFAGGNNEGARHATGEVIALINGDAIPEPDALAHLAEVALEPGVGIASASIRLADRPELLNSGGNEIHFTGLSWSGRFEERADRWTQPEDITAASGTGLAMRRSLFDTLGGLEEKYFIYHEDAQISLRCWQRGLRVVYVPDAVVLHHYEFSKNPRKLFLLERNRLLTVLTLYGGRTLLVLAPALVAMELALTVLAVREGWLRQKVAGWQWLVSNRRWVRQARRKLQAERTVPDRELARLFSDRIKPGNYPVSPLLAPLDRLLAGYWAIARLAL